MFFWFSLFRHWIGCHYIFPESHNSLVSSLMKMVTFWRVKKMMGFWDVSKCNPKQTRIDNLKNYQKLGHKYIILFTVIFVKRTQCRVVKIYVLSNKWARLKMNWPFMRPFALFYLILMVSINYFRYCNFMTL